MNFDYLFNAKSIAIIGASRREKTVGNDVVKNLTQQGYEGKIYPVNPKADSIYGLDVYSKVADIPKDFDLAVFAIPAKYIPSELHEIAKKGAKAAIIISAGFKEIGNQDLEDQVREICEKEDIVLVGPNCLGVINAQNKMNASFAALMPEEGNIAFMSQSGALCTAVLDYAQDLGIGFSKFISLGNKASTDEASLIKYFFSDEQTDVIAMYTEELQNAPELIELIKKHNQGSKAKPIIALKSGRTSAGAAAIASHTGSLSGGDNAYEALFQQAGIIRAEDIRQLFDLAQIFSKNELKEVENIGIITNAGGPGVLTTDEVVYRGLKLAELSKKTTKKLKSNLPAAASAANPVDVLGDAQADRYEMTLEALDEDSNVDAVLVILTPQTMTQIDETAKVIVKAHKKTQKPIAVSFMGRPTVASGVEIMTQAGIATTAFPEPAAHSLAEFSRFVKNINKPAGKVKKFADVDKQKVKSMFKKAAGKDNKVLPEAEAIKVMEAYKLPLLKTAEVTSAKQALKQAQKINTKLAMKIISHDILHKSDAGGVLLNVSPEEADQKYEELMATVKKNKPQAKLEGALLMEMAPNNGLEMILGLNKAEGLGTMVVTGLGGIYTEIFKDISTRFVPVTNIDIEEMINSLKTAEVLYGARGQDAYDIEALAECIARVSQMAVDFEEIKELDINPLLVLPKGQGVKVLDARIIL